MEGTVYLIHLNQPLGGEGFKSATHYIGWTSEAGVSVERRLAEHRAGNGARMLAYAAEHGITFDVVRTWTVDPATGRPPTRAFERRLKDNGHVATKCPVCRKDALAREAAQQRTYRDRHCEAPVLA